MNDNLYQQFPHVHDDARETPNPVLEEVQPVINRISRATIITEVAIGSLAAVGWILFLIA